MLGELFVSTAICSPQDGDTLPHGGVVVRGYAVGHEAAPLDRVELSTDGGDTWTRATLLGQSPPWAWQLWEARVELPPGDGTIIARAIDAQGRTQPADLRQTWNFKGYMNNAWHRIAVRVKSE